MWTRNKVESLNSWDRPKVRCRVNGETADRHGRITPNGEVPGDPPRPWVEVWVNGKWIAAPTTWGAVLTALNDRYAPPVELPAA